MNENATPGELRVRADFNPSANDNVSIIKNKTAELINIIDGIKILDARLAAIAMTTFEEAAMWAVKLATTNAGEVKTSSTE